MIRERIQKLREIMQAQKINALIIPSTDEHRNEYPPAHSRRREWASGFTGSAGDLAITHNKAGLWTDSRYFLQAEIQLKGTGIELHKLGNHDDLPMDEWLKKELKPGMALGLDGNLISANESSEMEKTFSRSGITVRYLKKNPVDMVWKNKPRLRHTPILIHESKYAGESFGRKLERVRKKMEEAGCQVYILTNLASIAWLFNFRGNDIQYNPLALSYAVVTGGTAHLFLAAKKITKELTDHFKEKVEILDYGKFKRFLGSLTSGKGPKPDILIDPDEVSRSIVRKLKPRFGLPLAEDPVKAFKAVKNQVELEGFKQAHVRDGIAMVKFLYWLNRTIPHGKVTEISAAEKLLKYRNENELFMGLSFETISSFGEHGAIVHYAPDDDSNAALAAGNLYLIDSGGHYLDGTTDITRTIALGDPTADQKRKFTLVLKGHINLALTIFPKGTKGIQIESIARRSLWKAGLDYGHGTGHGVGFYSSVHERPPALTPVKSGNAKLEPGMVLSIEPGYYEPGRMGIRIENLYYVDTADVSSESGADFYGFKWLTCCPLDRSLIDPSLLTNEELDFINAYHEWVNARLKGHLDAELREWLKTATERLQTGGAP